MNQANAKNTRPFKLAIKAGARHSAFSLLAFRSTRRDSSKHKTASAMAISGAKNHCNTTPAMPPHENRPVFAE